MKNTHWIIVVFFATALLASVFPEQVKAFDSPRLIEQHSALLAASEQKRTFEQVRTLGDKAWQQTSADVLNFSLDPREHWLRIRLSNPHPEQVSLHLLLDQPIQDYIDYWQVDNAGVVQQHVQTGDRRPFSNRLVNHRSFIFPVDLQANTSATLYIRLDSHDGLHEAIPLRILTTTELHHWLASDALWYGFYYGALTILLAYNLIIGFLTKEKDFYLYSLYLGVFFIWNLLFRGYGFQYLWPENPVLMSQILSLSVSGIFITLTAFTMVFLNLKNKMPKLGKLIVVLTAFQTIPILFTLNDDYTLFFTSLMPVAALQLITILTASIYLAWKGSRSAKIYTLAWGILIISVLIYFTQVIGAIPANSLTSNIINVGSLIEMLALALALVDKINQMKQQQTQALKTNLSIQQENNTELEQLVAEKTAQLTLLNKQLEQDAITDALTGLYNRRRIPTLYEERFDHCSQQDEFVGFILLDIDHFKQINDRYGHQDGDQVLVDLAKTMQGFWEPSAADLFRFGGEEFGIITCHKNQQELASRIHDFQQLIGQTSLHATQKITISVGAVIMPSQASIDLDSAIAEADGLLYDAKHQGRDLCLIKEL